MTSPQVDRAWNFVAIGFAIAMISSGLSFAVGPLVTPITADLGVSSTFLSGVIAARTLLYGVALVLAGRLADQWGTRTTAVIGSIILGASLILTASTQSITVFTISFALLAPVGHAATGQTVLSTILGRWFQKRRGLAMTFLSSGAMGGIGIMTPLLTLLVDQLGWRGAYTTTAAAIVLILGPLAFFGLREPARSQQGARAHAAHGDSWAAALRTPAFWVLGSSFFACGFSMSLLSAHGVPMLEHHGFDTMTASLGIGIIGMVSVFGSLALGAASDRFGRPGMLALIYGGRGIGFLALLFVSRDWELFLVTATAGLVWAGSSSLTSALTADIYGVRWLGTLFGWIYLLHQIGGAIASYLGGWAFDTHNSYMIPYMLSGLVLFTAAALAWSLARWTRPANPEVAAITGD